MDNPLDRLKPYFSDLSVFDEEKIDILHSIFMSDLMDNVIELDGKKLIIKRHAYNPKKDDLPDFFVRYFEKFVHIITRKNYKTNKREFNADRANRIHWIKPILDNFHDPRISHFRNRESNDNIREYFWYKEKGYIVILQEISHNYFLITGFCVDTKNVKYYERKEAKRL